MEEYEFNADDPRIKTIAKKLRGWITFDAAVDLLAAYMFASDLDKAIADEISDANMKLGVIAKRQHENLLAVIDVANTEHKIAVEAVGRIVKIRTASSDRGKVAAEARHSKPGGSRSKQDEMRRLWATGKYSSRNVCAEEECGGVDLSFSKARKALIGTPDNA